MCAISVLNGTCIEGGGLDYIDSARRFVFILEGVSIEWQVTL